MMETLRVRKQGEVILCKQIMVILGPLDCSGYFLKLYLLRVESFALVGAASCRDGEPVAARCRSYRKTKCHQIERFQP
jgi:hypothetical protein